MEKAKESLYAKIKKQPRESDNRIVEDPYDENQFIANDSDSSDWRKCPKWEISYRQQVTASDVYLQVICFI